MIFKKKNNGNRNSKISNLMLINLILLAFITFLFKTEIDSRASFLTEGLFNSSKAIVAAFKYAVTNLPSNSSGTINVLEDNKETSFSFSISNKDGQVSDVAMNYGLIIKFPNDNDLKNDLDNGYIKIKSITLNDGSNTTNVDLNSNLTKSNNGLTYTYSNVGEFLAGVEKNITCTVTISASQESSPHENELIDVNAYFEQKN